MNMRSLSVVFPASCIVAAAVLVPPSDARAAVLLTVDITNPTSVVIATTGAAASAASSGSDYAVRLDGALTSGGQNFLGVFAGSLTNTVGGTVYFGASRFQGGDSLHLIRAVGSTQTFIPGQQAFTGSVTSNLSFLPFAAPGTIGDIYVITDFGAETGIIVGQYQIVPTPGAAVVLGLGGLMAARRRR